MVGTSKAVFGCAFGELTPVVRAHVLCNNCHIRATQESMYLTLQEDPCWMNEEMKRRHTDKGVHA